METLEYATRDPEAAHQYLSEQYVDHRQLISGRREGFRFKASSVAAGPLRMDHMHHTMDVECDADPFADLTSIRVKRGRLLMINGRESAHLAENDSCIFPFGVNLRSAWADVDLDFFRLPLTEGARVAHELTGMKESDFRVESLTPVTPALGLYWGQLVGLVSDQLSAPDSAMASPIIAADIATTMARALLRVFATTALRSDGAEPARVAPAALRRAVDYIDAHAGRPLSLSEIAEASGVGARALQIAFARHHGVSPMGYVRRVRLEGAHQELKAADPTREVTVAAIARRWGFDTPSHFTSMYRKAYGQRPSQTLRD